MERPQVKAPVILAVGMMLSIANSVWAAPTRAVYASPMTGVRYAVSTGTELGTCGPIEHGYSCTSGTDVSITVLADAGCGAQLGSASCTIVVDEPRYPAGISTLECSTQNYELSAGGKGECTPNNGRDMTCRQTGNGNYATATCSSGCGSVNGTGSCTPTARPK